MAKKKYIQLRFYEAVYEIDAAIVVDYHLDNCPLYEKEYSVWSEAEQKYMKVTRQEAFDDWYHSEPGDLMDLIWDMSYKDIHPHLILVEEEYNIPSRYEQWERLGNVKTIQVVSRKKSAQSTQDPSSN